MRVLHGAEDSAYDLGYEDGPSWQGEAGLLGSSSRHEDADMLDVVEIEDDAEEQRDGSRDNERVPLVDVRTGRSIGGSAAPMRKNLEAYLRERPHMQVFKPATESRKRASESSISNPAMVAGPGPQALDARHRNSDQSKRPKQLEAVDAAVLAALECWVEAVQTCEEALDNDTCAQLMTDLLSLHHEIKSKQYQGDVSALQALTCQFPQQLVECMKQASMELQHQPLHASIAAALECEQSLSDAKVQSETELFALIKQRKKDLEKLKERSEAVAKEATGLEKQESDFFQKHQQALMKERLALEQLEKEEEQIREQLFGIDKEIAQELAALAPNHPELDMQGETHLEDPAKVKVGEAENLELLRAKGSIDRASEFVSASEDHLNLMAQMADLAVESRESIHSICNDSMIRVLETEIRQVEEDRVILANCCDALSPKSSGSKNGNSAGTDQFHWVRFHKEQIDAVRQRQIRSRYVASGLQTYLRNYKDDNMDSKLMRLATTVLENIDATHSKAWTVKSKVLPSLSEGLASVRPEFDAEVVCWEGHSNGNICEHISATASSLSDTAGGTSCVLRCKEQCIDTAEIEFIDAWNGGWNGSSIGFEDTLPSASTVFTALDRVCRGVTRRSICLIPETPGLECRDLAEKNVIAGYKACNPTPSR